MILLIQPPVEDFYLTRKRTIPYGLASICASLKTAGFNARILDGLATPKSRRLPWPKEFEYLNPYYGRPDHSLFSLFHTFRHFGYSFEHIGTTVRDLNPFLVGISSLFTPYWDSAEQTARAVKRFCPDVPVVMGGHHPTRFPEQVLSCPHVDYVLRGEGEESMAALCRALKGEASLDAVPGIAHGQDHGQVIRDPHWTRDLGQCPLPDPKAFAHPYYRRNKKAAITVVASRGCPMPCTYCSVSATSSHGNFRRRPVTTVLGEIEARARNQAVGFIDFEDENLTLDKHWFLELMAGIRRIFADTPVELRAMNGLFPPSLDKDIVAAMAKAGFKTLNLSLGSVSRVQLAQFRRPDVRDAHQKAMAMARQSGLSTVSYIIAGAPNQSAASSLEDLLYLARHPTLAGLSIFYPAPGSRDFLTCKDLGCLPEKFSLMRSSALPLDGTTRRIQSATLLRLARILNFMKSCLDHDGHLPAPLAFDPGFTLPPDRRAATLKLLQWFLWDGCIRGVDDKGRVYAHHIDRNLALKFADSVQNTSLAGVTPG